MALCNAIFRGGGGILDSNLTIFHLFAAIVGSWGQLGVDLFIIVSVFFFSKKSGFRTAKAVDLILESIFYGLLWTVICVQFVSPLSIRDILSGTFAIFTGANWFAFAYILLYFFHPL